MRGGGQSRARHSMGAAGELEKAGESRRPGNWKGEGRDREWAGGWVNQANETKEGKAAGELDKILWIADTESQV